jgi:hypothetical protein
MPSIARPFTFAAIATLTVLAGVRPVHGQVTFTLNQPASSLALSGTVAGAPITAQGPGSLTTTYSGAFVFSGIDLSGGTATFDSTSTALNAAVSGNWQPMTNGVAGSEPADYGGTASVFVGVGFTNVLAALRNGSLGVSGSPTVPLTPTGSGTYTFPANQTLDFLLGGLDYRDSLGVAAPGRDDLTGQSAVNGSATPATLQSLGGNLYDLVYPVDVTLNLPITTGVTANIRILGTIDAQGTIAVPEPATGSLLAAVGVTSLLAKLRSRRRGQNGERIDA